MFDVVIVGGGPAGLSAALILGRCLRRVVVCDAGEPRNARSRSLNGYLTRDGIAPADFLAAGRGELEKYGVVHRCARIAEVRRDADGFRVVDDTGVMLQAHAVLLATGVRDHLPDIPGLGDCYGTTVHHCPYCDGWEVSGRRIAAIGDGVSPVGLALSLKTWSHQVVACTNGQPSQRGSRRRLAAHGIPLYESRIVRFEHDEGHVREMCLEDGTRVACDAVFFAGTQSQQCALASQLGCEFTEKGTVKTDHLGRSCVPGIYVVGDASRDVQFAVVAASEGAKAGVAINRALQARAGLTIAPA